MTMTDPGQAKDAHHTVTLKLSPVTIGCIVFSVFLLFGVGLWSIGATNATAKESQRTTSEETLKAMGCLVGYTYYRGLVTSTREGTPPSPLPEFGNLRTPSLERIANVDLRSVCQPYIDKAFAPKKG